MTQRWHVARWGTLGWIETALKMTAIVVAIAALARVGTRALPQAAAAQMAVAALGLATVGLVVAIADRLVEREVIAMVFVVANVIGHGTMTLVSASLPDGRWAVLAFCVLMALGDVVKIVFMRRRRFRVRTVGTTTLVRLTGAYITLYVFGALGAALA